jgi:predicted membrane-bound dolichyl-phosphate-mannose-protein mannosyltransferase
MTELPKALRYSPFVFYMIAAIMGMYQFASYFAANWRSEIQGYTAPHSNAFDWFEYLVSSQPFAMGISEAAYMASNGVLAHLLIAIFDKMKGPGE